MTLPPKVVEAIAQYRAKQAASLDKKRISQAATWHKNQSLLPKPKRRVWRYSHAQPIIEVPPWAREPADDVQIADETSRGPALALAPGCFGMSLLYRIDGKECVPCPFHQRCRPQAAKSWISLSAERAADSKFHQEYADRKSHDQVRNRKAKAKSRAKLKAASPPISLPPVARLTLETLKARQAELVDWLAQDKPPQRQYRKHKKEILRDYAVMQTESRQPNVKLGPTAFAKALSKVAGTTITIASAQKRLERLRLLESAEGPWFTPESIPPL